MSPLAGITVGLVLFVSSMSSPGQEPAGTTQPDSDVAQYRTRMRAYLDSLHAEYEFRWHEVRQQEGVQYGLPDTAAAAIRIDCREGRIGIMGDAETTGEVGSSFTVVFANGDRRTATLIDRGDTDAPIFLVEVAPDDPLLAWMLSRNRIEIEAADLYEGPGVFISVPTAGGLELLRSLIGGCRR